MKSIIPFVYIALVQFKIVDGATSFKTYSEIYFKLKN